MLRRLLSVSILLPAILLLLWLDFYLGSSDGLAMPGLIMAVIAIVLGSIMALEIRAFWTFKPSESGSNFNGRSNDALKENLRKKLEVQGELPSVRCLISGTVIMLTTACLLPVCLPVVMPIQPTLSAASILEDVRSTGNATPIQFSFYGLIAAVTWTFAVEMYRFKGEKEQAGVIANRISRSVLVYVYVLMLLGFLIPHRWLFDDNRVGLIALIGLIATVKMSDSFAYFVGKSMGTVKLAPELSPKKTVQGACGAILGGVVASFIVFYSVAPFLLGVTHFLPIGWVVVYAVLISAAAMFGDLAESLLKRDASCKDSGSMLPGMGGMLDVLDSLVFAAPVSYMLWQWQSTWAGG